MILRPIDINEDVTLDLYGNEYCKSIFQHYPSYYLKTGYNPPWIGYFVIDDNFVAGVGGFISAPVNNTVEIGYGTRPGFENKGIATFTCSQLISIAQIANTDIIITAKTAPEENASVKVLKKNGFYYNGNVHDDDIGLAWHWLYRKR